MRSISERRAAAVLATLLVGGCATFDANDERYLRENTIAFHRTGAVVEPAASGAYSFFTRQRPVVDAASQRAQLNDIVVAAKDFCGPRPEPCRVVLYIHGGLTSMTQALAGAVQLAPSILDEGRFPIFVAWEAGLFPSLWDHWFRVRQGQDQNLLIGSLTSPLVLFSDLLRGMAQAPGVWYDQVKQALDSLDAINPEEQKAADRVAERLVCRTLKAMASEPDGVLRVAVVPVENCEEFRDAEVEITTEAYPAPDDSLWENQTRRASWASVGRAVNQILTAPLKFAESPIVDTLGTAAWREMKRKNTLIFNRRVELDNLIDGGSTDTRAESLGLPLLLKMLTELEIPLELDLIGHSMGAFTVNGVLRHALAMPNEVPPIRNIVYMAAADSVRSYQDSAFAYLRRDRELRANQNGAPTEVFHLVLNSRDDVRETFNPFGPELLPRGSLLVWIDSYFEKQLAWRDRTAGRYVNLLTVIGDTPADFAKQIHVRSYPEELQAVTRNPTTHGSFTKGKFWREEFWTPWSPFVFASD